MAESLIFGERIMLLSKMKFAVAEYLKHRPFRISQIRRLAEYLSPEDTALFDYRVKSVPRWPLQTPHPELYRILNAQRTAESLKEGRG